MRDVDRIARQLNEAWNGPAWHGPALYEVLKGVTAAQAAARPLRNAHSIWEIVLHVGAWESVAARRSLGETVKPGATEDWPPVTDTGEGGWQRSLAALAECQLRLLAALDHLNDADLARTAPGEKTTLGFMLDWVIDHDLYHAGQIALLKKGSQ